MKTIAITGTFDTKGMEFSYVKKMVESLGLKTFMIHTGVFEPSFVPEVNNDVVAAAAGYDIGQLAARKDRATATEALAKGMSAKDIDQATASAGLTLEWERCISWFLKSEMVAMFPSLWKLKSVPKPR